MMKIFEYRDFLRVTNNALTVKLFKKVNRLNPIHVLTAQFWTNYVDWNLYLCQEEDDFMCLTTDNKTAKDNAWIYAFRQDHQNDAGTYYYTVPQPRVQVGITVESDLYLKTKIESKHPRLVWCSITYREVKK